MGATKNEREIPEDAAKFFEAYKAASPFVQRAIDYVLFSPKNFEEVSDKDLASVHYFLSEYISWLREEMDKRGIKEIKYFDEPEDENKN